MEVNIEDLKKEHGDIHTLTLNDKSGQVVATAYLKDPDRNQVARAMSLIAQTKVFEAGEFLLENCLVAGEDSILSTPKVKMSAAMQAVQLVEMLDGELKKN
ncbi:hypothetical protein LGH70_19535 [Hymenobacter sp. BT635]|uniref:Uncharacterized protein n=1 Tax=Hymenobacter nitidus TaxID=2880929 RepID=A0ABS8AH86_9BACT|nr:hypothetical protein [Hymenobacter nitidus]MCB2379798.1 hypothetical protein [Hymenobacter nitidus]